MPFTYFAKLTPMYLILWVIILNKSSLQFFYFLVNYFQLERDHRSEDA